MEEKSLLVLNTFYLYVLCLGSRYLFARKWIGWIGVDRLAHSKHDICILLQRDNSMTGWYARRRALHGG
jgi:hypothetical protein